MIRGLFISRDEVDARARFARRFRTAERGQTEYGICSTTFLEKAFRTDSYKIEVDFHDDGSWSYVSETTLLVHGRDTPFLHRDTNTLAKVAEPDLNPWARIIRDTGKSSERA